MDFDYWIGVASTGTQIVSRMARLDEDVRAIDRLTRDISDHKFRYRKDPVFDDVKPIDWESIPETDKATLIAKLRDQVVLQNAVMDKRMEARKNNIYNLIRDDLKADKNRIREETTRLRTLLFEWKAMLQALVAIGLEHGVKGSRQLAVWVDSLIDTTLEPMKLPPRPWAFRLSPVYELKEPRLSDMNATKVIDAFSRIGVKLIELKARTASRANPYDKLFNAMPEGLRPYARTIVTFPGRKAILIAAGDIDGTIRAPQTVKAPLAKLVKQWGFINGVRGSCRGYYPPEIRDIPAIILNNTQNDTKDAT